jgi:hypothetical protein
MRELWLVVANVERRCVAEGWTGRMGETDGVALTPADVNMYHLNQYLLIPATAHRGCSLVELVAAAPRPTVVFLSHAWAHPFKLTVEVRVRVPTAHTPPRAASRSQ